MCAYGLQCFEEGAGCAPSDAFRMLAVLCSRAGGMLEIDHDDVERIPSGDCLSYECDTVKRVLRLRYVHARKPEDASS